MTARSPQLSRSDDDSARLSRVERYARDGPAHVGALMQMLLDPSWSVRRAVVDALAAVGTPAVAPLCRVLREQRDDEGRLAAAVDALSASVADCDEALLELTRDPNPAVVSDAVQALGRRRTSHVARLAELAMHDDDNVAVAAVEALGRVGGPATLDALAQAVHSERFFRVFPAIDVLGRVGDPRAVELLAGLLPTPLYAPEAIRALGKTGAPSAAPVLAGLLLRGLDVTVRLAATSLQELRRRFAAQYGTTAAVDHALRNTVEVETAARRVMQALGTADADEQAAICTVLGALGTHSAIPTLTSLLDGPPHVMSAAAAALRDLGRGSEGELVRALREADSARRRLLLPLVTRSTAAGEVARCLSDPDPEVRAAACETLGRLGNPASVRALFPLLSDESQHVVYAATSAIQTLGGREAETLALKAAKAPSPVVRRAGIRVLGYFGYPGAGATLLRALSDPDEQVRHAALQGLPLLDDPHALPALLDAARSPDARTRAAAMRALGSCPSEVRVPPMLLTGLHDADPWVRYYAAQSLGRLGCDVAVEQIARLLDDPAGQVQVAAVEALSHLRSDTAFAALRGAVEASDPDVQRAALVGLGIRGRPESLGPLLSAVRSEDSMTRLVAVSALSGFEDRTAVEALAHAATDADERVRTAATDALASHPSEHATAMLVGLLRTSAPAERVLAGLAIPSDARIQGLLSALDTADDELARHLTSALARMHRPEALKALIASMSVTNAAARKAAATSLSATGNAAALATVKRAATDDPDPEVRSACAMLLAH